NVQKYSHNYPHCWRTDKPVLYYPLDSWFIRTTAVKDRMIELNKTIQWKPAHTGEKRFGNWLENLQDWNLSRSRYWGIPLPIWRTADNSDEISIGSIAELQSEIDKANKVLGLSQDMPKDLHRPYIDDVILVSDGGKEMKRELDLIDVWFDSGSMPYAQMHYPFENKELLDSRFPADFIAEGVDQTRGWFFTLHAIASMVFDSVAYKTVISNGLVLDKNGVKMSKRLGNAVDPFETLNKYGVDATRWYMISNASPWDNLKFDEAGIEEVRRKFFATMFQTFKFFSLYANIDHFNHSEGYIPLENRQEIDKWIISLLNTLKKEVDADFAAYEPTQAARRIQSFADSHLSNWYVRLCRRRFWKGEYSKDKIAAYQTLYECLSTISKLIAPISPYFSDWLFKNLNDVSQLESHPSVHLVDFPQPVDGAIDKALEERMDYAQRISSLVLSLRKKDNLRVRQPLKRILLPVLNPQFQGQVEALKDLIMAEVNVKDIEYITDTSGIIKKKAKANFKTLGRKLGKDMKAAAAIIQKFDNDTITQIEKSNSYIVDLGEVKYEIDLEDLEIIAEDVPGWQVASDKELTVALDIQLDDALIAEGVARELVNRIQNLRKSNEFQVTDRINVKISDHVLVKAALAGHTDYIAAEVLANSVSMESNCGEEIELLDGDIIFIEVKRD
ncbi:MAG TPA: isoleucine--tRNA ligase, partial [Saprospirales bacterium]|nr:isoleucine--tRNA ligase [Saprospirales bacterium]